MVPRNVPGIGPKVTFAFAPAMAPMVLGALSYAAMASARLRAGGSYVYASRSLHPYLGLLASFSQWLGLSFAMGVVAYVLVPFVRDIALSFSLERGAELLESGPVRLVLALLFLWSSTFLNLLGMKVWGGGGVVLMMVGVLGGGIVIATGFAHDQADLLEAVAKRDLAQVSPVAATGASDESERDTS